MGSADGSLLIHWGWALIAQGISSSMEVGSVGGEDEVGGSLLGRAEDG